MLQLYDVITVWKKWLRRTITWVFFDTFFRIHVKIKNLKQWTYQNLNIQSLQFTISKNQWNYHDKIPRLIKNFKRTVTFPLFTKHRVAGQPFNIPLMFNLVLWNNFLIKNGWTWRTFTCFQWTLCNGPITYIETNNTIYGFYFHSNFTLTCDNRTC